MNYSFSIRRVLIATALIIVVGIIAFALFWRGAIFEAQGQALFSPYGGTITRVSYECCYGHIVTITDKTTNIPQDYMYYPLISDLNQYYQIFFAGPTVLGDSFPIGYCLDAGDYCSPNFVGPTIRQVGTTLSF